MDRALRFFEMNPQQENSPPTKVTETATIFYTFITEYMNIFIVTGNVGNVEAKTTTSGKSVLNFGLAESITKGQERETQWHRRAIFDREKLVPFITKGKKLLS